MRVNANDAANKSGELGEIKFPLYFAGEIVQLEPAINRLDASG